MQKFLLLIFFLLVLSAKNYAQTDSLKSISVKDSTELMNELMELLSGSEKPSSYFTASIGIGNRLFNVRNNALNAKQSSINKFIYSPTIAYYHKTGVSFSASANLFNDSVSGFGVNQYSISPGYQLQNNKNFYFAFVYTHYFVNDIFSSYTSPLQNDFYTSLNYKKTWIQPGMALGYSTGKYGDIKRRRALYDSITNNIQAFTFIISAAHEFNWNNIFDKKDGMLFSPTLLLNTATSKINIHHNTNATNLLYFLGKKGRLPKFKTSPYQVESAGLSIDLMYVYGKFSFEPEAYFDYYLPSTQENRFTSVFTFNLSYSF